MGGFSFAREVAHMDEFVFMLGRIAAKHDTLIAHAMLHAVAVWIDGHGRKD
jgi:hypothetical protein